MLPSRLRVISAEPDDTAAIEEALRAIGVNEPQRYFTDAPFVGGAKTYVLTKMWGRGTEPTRLPLLKRPAARNLPAEYSRRRGIWSAGIAQITQF